jgi:hypothetical protein
VYSIIFDIYREKKSRIIVDLFLKENQYIGQNLHRYFFKKSNKQSQSIDAIYRIIITNKKK